MLPSSPEKGDKDTAHAMQTIAAHQCPDFRQAKAYCVTFCSCTGLVEPYEGTVCFGGIVEGHWFPNAMVPSLFTVNDEYWMIHQRLPSLITATAVVSHGHQ